jgi:hypothetical protein
MGYNWSKSHDRCSIWKNYKCEIVLLGERWRQVRPRRIFDPASTPNFYFYINHGLTVKCIASFVLIATHYSLRLTLNDLIDVVEAQ